MVGSHREFKLLQQGGGLTGRKGIQEMATIGQANRKTEAERLKSPAEVDDGS